MVLAGLAVGGIAFGVFGVDGGDDGGEGGDGPGDEGAGVVTKVDVMP